MNDFGATAALLARSADPEADARRLADLGVSRLAWADYWGDRRKAAIARVRADYADTVARYGAVLHPRLAEQARAIRTEYGETPWARRSA